MKHSRPARFRDVQCMVDERQHRGLDDVAQFVDAGRIRVLLERTFPLEATEHGRGVGSGAGPDRHRSRRPGIEDAGQACASTSM
jgi:hypothetical protein